MKWKSNDLYLNLQQAASDLIKVKEALINEGVEISDDTEVTTYADKITSLYSDDVETMRLAWWDVVTGKNTKPTYDNMFRYMDFDLIGGFNPPYTIKPTYCGGCFSYARGITKIKKEHINWTDNASLNYAFANCYDLEEVEEIEISSQHMWLFANCSKLHTIGNLILREGCLFNSNSPFANCNALENITLTGVILNSVSFQWSPLLTIESIENIISVLSDDVTGQTLTLNKAAKTAYYNAHSTEYANADEAWNALVSTRPNWRITLV